MSDNKVFGLDTDNVFETAAKSIKNAYEGVRIMEEAFYTAVHAAYLKGFSDAKKGLEYNYETINNALKGGE